MAHSTEYEKLIGKAESAADRAMDAIPNTPGASRGALHASLAAMWMEAARVELQATEVKAMHETLERIRNRLRRVEAELKIFVPAADADDPASLL